jgi:hypothetical protein
VCAVPIAGTRGVDGVEQLGLHVRTIA